MGEKYQAKISYGGASKNLGVFATKEQAGMAYDQFVVDKSTEEVSFTLNYVTQNKLALLASQANIPASNRNRPTTMNFFCI